ncbi:MAG: response regulator [Sphingomonadales bacterium]|nr:response regulator [Sphingomonadales bacterium]
MSKLRILVADDDELLAELITHKLELAGYDVIYAEDGDVALKKINEEKPDAIILDGMMPGLDGFDVLRTIKENDDTKSIPVVMLTARGMGKDVVSGLELGAADYLVKPFMPEELVSRLERVLE